MNNLYWGFALVCFGGLMLLDNLGYADMGDIISTFWPVALILLGLNVVLKQRSAPSLQHGAAGMAAPIDSLQASSIFGDISAETNSKAFTGGSVSTLLGDARIDLCAIVIAPGRHELRVHSLFGSSTIRLAKGAPCAVEASTTFGTITILGESKSGFTARVRVESPAFAQSPNALTIHISHMFGAARVEEASSPS